MRQLLKSKNQNAYTSTAYEYIRRRGMKQKYLQAAILIYSALHGDLVDTKEYQYPLFLPNGQSAGTIILREGDITEAKNIDALVNPIDTNADMSTGTAQAIATAADKNNFTVYFAPKEGYTANTNVKATLGYFNAKFRNDKLLPLGTSFVAPSLGLLDTTGAPYIITIVSAGANPKKIALETLYTRCFQVATEINNLATRPKIGGGHGQRYPLHPKFYQNIPPSTINTDFFSGFTIQTASTKKPETMLDLAISQQGRSTEIITIAREKLMLPIHTIAFPLIGTGFGAFPSTDSARAVIQTIMQIMREYATSVTDSVESVTQPGYLMPYTVIIYFYNNNKLFTEYAHILQQESGRDIIALLHQQLTLLNIIATAP